MSRLVARRGAISRPTVASIPISFPQSIGNLNTAGTVNTTIALTTTGAVAAGSSIFVMWFVASPTVTLSSIVDSAGNTYTVDTSVLNAAAAGAEGRIAIASCHNVVALPLGGTITATDSGTSQLRTLAALKSSGLASSAVLDKTGTGTGATAAWATAATAALTQANEVAIYAVANIVDVTVNTPGAGFIDVLDYGSGSRRFAFGYRIVASTDAVTAAGTMGVDQWAAALATYKGLASTAPPIPLVTVEDFETGIVELSPVNPPPGVASGWVRGQTFGAAPSGAWWLESTAIGMSAEAAIEFTFTVPVGRTADITFFTRTSSESGFDFLRVMLNGVEKLALSGETASTLRTIAVTAGTHELRFRYVKDAIVVAGLDKVAIDKLTVTQTVI